MSDIDTIFKLKNAIDELTNQFIAGMDQIKVKDHLDSRCGNIMYVSTEGIAFEKKYKRSFWYYAGFEYIDEDYVSEIGEYIFIQPDCENPNCKINNIITKWENDTEKEVDNPS
jgi:hypothetical protein